MGPSVTVRNGSPHRGDSEHTGLGLCRLAGEPAPSALWILPVMCEGYHSEESLVLCVHLCAYVHTCMSMQML